MDKGAWSCIELVCWESLKAKRALGHLQTAVTHGRIWGGVSGVATPPNGQSHSATDVLSHADALIYMAKSLVVVVVSLYTSCKTTLQRHCGVA